MEHEYKVKQMRDAAMEKEREIQDEAKVKEMLLDEV